MLSYYYSIGSTDLFLLKPDFELSWQSEKSREAFQLFSLESILFYSATHPILCSGGKSPSAGNKKKR